MYATRMSPGVFLSASFAVAALMVVSLGAGWTADDPFAASGLPPLLYAGLLAVATFLIVRETTGMFAAEAPGPWIQTLAMALPAAMGIAAMAGAPVLALAVETVGCLGLWILLRLRLSAAPHRRHPGPLIASYAALILAAGAAAGLLGLAGVLPEGIGGMLHGTAFRAFLPLVAIAFLRWSGSTGLRTGLAPFASLRLRLSLAALMASFLADACADLGWLGDSAYSVSAPIRMLLLARIRARVPGILPMLPESAGLVRGIRLGLILEIAALGAGLAPTWLPWNPEGVLRMLGYALTGGSMAFGAARVASLFALPKVPIRTSPVRGFPSFFRRIA